MIWKTKPDFEAINHFGKNTLQDFFEIEFFEIGDDYIKAKMPVNAKNVQPMRRLHGGANVALAETMGSVASFFCIEDSTKQTCFGIEINANHLLGVPEGEFVIATAKPIRIGKTLQVWNIDIHDNKGRLSCVSRLTVAVVDIK